MGILDAIGGGLTSLGNGISNFQGGLASNLFPVDPTMAGYADPANVDQMRRLSMMKLGLGIAAAARSGNPNGTLDAFNGAQSDYQGAMDRAFHNTLIKRQLDQQNQDREYTLKQRAAADRAAAATTANKVSVGITNASSNPAQLMSYWNLVGHNPDVQAAMAQFGVDPAQYANATPEQVAQLGQTLGGQAKIYAQQVAPIKLSAGDTLLTGDTMKPILTAPEKPKVEYRDAGDRLIAVDANTGIPVPGLPAIRKGQMPSAEANKPALVDVPMPDGTVQKQWVTPGQMTGPSVGAPVAPKGAQPDTQDKKNAVLLDSLRNAENDIQKLSKDATGAPNPSATDTGSLWNAGLEGVPLIGGKLKIFQSDAYRKYEAAGLRWAANLLYLKSGATANPSEIVSTWKQFFPQPGEGEGVKSQKEVSRQQEIASVSRQYGPKTGTQGAGQNLDPLGIRGP